MEWLTEQNLENDLKNLPKFRMTNDAYASIERQILNTRSPRRFSRARQAVVALAGIAVVSVIGTAIIQTQHAVTPKYQSGSETAKHSTSNQGNFPYVNYLGFQPQSPANDLGLKLSSSSIDVDGQEGSSISAPSFTELFGDSHTHLLDNKLKEASTGWFELTEQSQQEVTPSLMGLRPDKTVSLNGIKVLISSDSNGDTHLGYVKDGVDFEFLFPKGYDLKTIEKTMANLVSVTTPPSTMTISDNISRLTSMLQFNPFVPVHVPSPFQQNGSYSVSSRAGSMLTIPFVSGNANFLVIETPSNNLSVQDAITTGRVQKINGQTVYIMTPSTHPNAYVTWTDPKASIGIQIMTAKQNLMQAEQLATLFMNSNEMDALNNSTLASSWNSLPQNAQYTAQAVYSLYSFSHPVTIEKLVKMTYPQQSKSITYGYTVNLKGNFQSGNKSATELSFTIVSSSDQVTNLTSYDDSHHVMWHENTIPVQYKDIVLRGTSDSWNVVVDTKGALATNPSSNMSVYASSAQLNLQYIPQDHGNLGVQFKYSVSTPDFGVGGYQGAQASGSTNSKGFFSEQLGHGVSQSPKGSGYIGTFPAMFAPNISGNATIEWNNSTQTVNLSQSRK